VICPPWATSARKGRAMSFRRTLFALLLVFALLAAPASFAAEQANPAGLWQAFTNWLISSLGLGDEVEGSDLMLPGGRPQGDSNEGGDIILPGGQPQGALNEAGYLIEPGG
jgi:hypothetical protein